MTEPSAADAAWVKLDLLSHGISLPDATRRYLASRSGVAVRKKVYNDPLWLSSFDGIPQELRLGETVVGLNSYGTSPWALEWEEDLGSLGLTHSSGAQYAIELVPDLNLFRCNTTASRVANLYGGAALAFFSPRTCYFFADDTQCGFCSLAGTAAENSSFQGLLSPSDVANVLRSALENDPGRIEQVMIVGGNMRDLDRGFLHHVELARAAARELFQAGLSEKISVHIATMPPRDLDALRKLSECGDIHVMFNLEVWDDRLFTTVCPGKTRDYGRNGILRALERLRDVIGPFKAHSLLIAGLEPAESTISGIEELANLGISAIVNVYHSDRHSRFGLTVRPSFRHLACVAQALQGFYSRFPLRPYWKTCGRNALDAEAQAGLFSSRIPEFLDHSAEGV